MLVSLYCRLRRLRRIDSGHTTLAGCTITHPQDAGIDGQMNQFCMLGDLQLAFEERQIV